MEATCQEAGAMGTAGSLTPQHHPYILDKDTGS